MTRLDRIKERLELAEYGWWADDDVRDLLVVAEAAKSLHAGLTCKNDPMDVPERIQRLGAALAVLDTEEA